MKAVQFAQYGGPEVLQVQEVLDPVPGPMDVLIQVKATTVNRLDLFQRDGSRPVPNLPYTPGLEAAGVVLRDNQGFHAGERVMTTRAAGAVGDFIFRLLVYKYFNLILCYLKVGSFCSAGFIIAG